MSNQLDDLCIELTELARRLMKSLDEEGDIPFNQRVSALGTILDKLPKLNQAARERSPQQQEEKVRFEYRYPDGVLRGSPPWAGDYPEVEAALSGRSLWEAFRQNGNWEAGPD